MIHIVYPPLPTVRGGRGGSRPIHNFEAHFCAFMVMKFLMEIVGLWVLFGTFHKVYIKYSHFGCFGEVYFFLLLFVTN